ncbi:MAG: DUF3999 family protein [Patescibacteria group bacterium]|nr:DUF3999 family protein [Patescibacteria group bacterium]
MKTDVECREVFSTRRPAAVVRTGIVVLLLASPLAATEPAAFRFSREVHTGTLEREEIVAIPLDANVYAHTRDQTPDLRLFDAGGGEVPFLLEQVTATHRHAVRKPWTVQPASLKPLEDGGLEIILTLDKDDPQPAGLTVATPLRDFEQRLRVFGSNDGQAWNLLVPDVLIFDYSRFMDVESRDVRLPSSEYRRFRVVIDAVTAEQESELMELTRRLRSGAEVERVERVLRDRRPFRIDRIEFWREIIEERSAGATTGEYPVAQFKVEQDAEHKQTIVTVHTRREPLTAFQLETPARNFNRAVSVERPESRGVRTEWRQLGRATLSRFAFRELNREQMEVGFPETRSEQYRLVIDNRDDPPLEITGVRATGNVYRMVYFAEPGKEYRLAYGSAAVKAPSYDTTALSASLREEYKPVVAELGQAIENTDVRPPSNLLAFLNNPVLLIGGVCLLVALLACGLYAAARRVDSLPDDVDIHTRSD